MLFCKLNKKIFLILIAAIIYIAINAYGIYCVYLASKNVKIVDRDNVYFSSNMEEDLNKDLKEVTEYIKRKEKEGIDVICISQDAAIYMTYLHKNH